MTLILRKLLASSTYAISGTLQGLADKLGATITKNEKNKLNVDEVFDDNYESFAEYEDEWADDEETVVEERSYTDDEIDEIRKEIKSLNEFKTLADSVKTNSKG